MPCTSNPDWLKLQLTVDFLFVPIYGIYLIMYSQHFFLIPGPHTTSVLLEEDVGRDGHMVQGL